MPVIEKTREQWRTEIAILYRVTRILMKNEGLAFDGILRGAFGKPRHVGPGYLDSFRKGKIARATASRIYNWLREKHPDYANHFDSQIAELYAHREPRIWRDFIEENGRFGWVFIREWMPPEKSVRKTDTTGSGTTQRIERITYDDWEERLQYEATMALNVPFQFLIGGIQRSSLVIGFQWSKGSWSILPLSENSGIAELKVTKDYLPKAGLPLEDAGLREPSETGLRQFVFVVLPRGKGRKLLAALPIMEQPDPDFFDEFARCLQGIGDDCDILRLNVMFVVTSHFHPGRPSAWQHDGQPSRHSRWTSPTPLKRPR